MPRFAPLLSVLFLAACMAPPPPVAPGARPSAAATEPRVAARQAVATFAEVVARMEPVAEAECRARAPRLNCDFLLVVDTAPGQGINAYQTLDRSGRPVIAFTPGLIADARSADEVAFVLGHEAAHHILGHIPRQGQTALAGALVLGALAAASGADPTAVRTAQDIGAEVGARRFSRDFELEADALGTVITHRAGFDPRRGAGFFARLPDPGNRFLGTHPPNAQRIATVERVLAGL